jgi:hypothetical protein
LTSNKIFGSQLFRFYLETISAMQPYYPKYDYNPELNPYLFRAAIRMFRKNLSAAAKLRPAARTPIKSRSPARQRHKPVSVKTQS